VPWVESAPIATLGGRWSLFAACQQTADDGGAFMSEVFGEALRELREGAGMSLRTLAERAHCSHSHIADLETGRRRPGVTLAEHLDGLLSAAGRLTRLADCTDGSTFRIRSHKFLAGYLGADAMGVAEALQAKPNGSRSPLFQEWSTPVVHMTGEATLYLWAHGGSIIHIIEESDWSDITSLARWRYKTYERDLEWASKEIVPGAVHQYVLSLYWIVRPAWAGDRLDRATRLICAPRAIVGEDPASCTTKQIELALLRDGFPASEGVVKFGTPDIAVGYASWSGIAYCPCDPARALAEQELVDVELATQAVWQYCSWIASEVEEGRDPDVPTGYGWRWLRGVRSRLLTARPQETGPHRRMRETIINTSGLPEMLDSVVTLLREI
jgi:transcriptional regulator with XRE-family HTH domain